MKCFYHSADLDGRCSGAIVKRANPNCELIGIDYGQPFPWDTIRKGEAVYMVDYSLTPFSEMERLSELCDLTWIDHHKTAIEERLKSSRFTGEAVLHQTMSACEGCWTYFFAPQAMPRSVNMLGRYDIWKHAEYPGSLEFQYGMRLYDADPCRQDFWAGLFDDSETFRIQGEGELLLRYETEQNRKTIGALGFECELDGLRCLAVNKGLTNAMVFESRWDPARHDAMLAFAYKDGHWKVSLYSDKPEIDVSAVCKARGGGGHKGAAGFHTDDLFFLPKGGA